MKIYRNASLFIVLKGDMHSLASRLKVGDKLSFGETESPKVFDEIAALVNSDHFLSLTALNTEKEIFGSKYTLHEWFEDITSIEQIRCQNPEQLTISGRSSSEPLKFVLESDYSLSQLNDRWESALRDGMAPSPGGLIELSATTDEMAFDERCWPTLHTREFDGIECVYLYTSGIDSWQAADMMFWSGINVFETWGANCALTFSVVDEDYSEEPTGTYYGDQFNHDLNIIFDSPEAMPDFLLFRDRATGLLSTSNGCPIKKCITDDFCYDQSLEVDGHFENIEDVIRNWQP